MLGGSDKDQLRDPAAETKRTKRQNRRQAFSRRPREKRVGRKDLGKREGGMLKELQKAAAARWESRKGGKR